MADAYHLIPAAETCLGVDADTPAATAFLRRLAEADGMPSAEQVEAAAVLGFLARDGEEFPALEARADRLFAERLEEFLAVYWETDPDARAAAWDDLSRLGGHVPRHRFRLDELRAGLAVSLPADEDPRYDPVLRVLETAFLAPVAARAFELSAARRKAGVSAAELSLLVNEFADQRPEFDAPLRVAGVLGNPIRPAADDERRRPLSSKRRQPAPPASTGWAVSLIMLIVAVVFGIVRGVMKDPTYNRPPVNYAPVVTYPPPSFAFPEMPKYEPPKFPDMGGFGATGNGPLGGRPPRDDPFKDLRLRHPDWDEMFPPPPAHLRPPAPLTPGGMFPPRSPFPAVPPPYVPRSPFPTIPDSPTPKTP